MRKPAIALALAALQAGGLPPSIGPVALPAGPASARAQATTTTARTDTTLTITATGPCLGEAVLVTGPATSLAQVTDDATGGVRATVRITVRDLVGTGLTSGARYSGAGSVGRTTATLSGPPPVEAATAPAQLALLGEGGAPDLLLTFRDHISVDADGAVTVDFSDVTVECSG